MSEPGSPSGAFSQPVESPSLEKEAADSIEAATALCRTEEGKETVARAALVSGLPVTPELVGMAITGVIRRVTAEDEEENNKRLTELTDQLRRLEYPEDEINALNDRFQAEIASKKSQLTEAETLRSARETQDRELVTLGEREGFPATFEGAIAAAREGRHELAAAICETFNNLDHDSIEAVMEQGDPTIFMWMRRHGLSEEREMLRLRMEEDWSFPALRFPRSLGRHAGRAAGPFYATLFQGDFAGSRKRMEIFAADHLIGENPSSIQMVVQSAFIYGKLPDQAVLRAWNSSLGRKLDAALGGQLEKTAAEISESGRGVYPYFSEEELESLEREVGGLLDLFNTVSSFKDQT